ncbi:hypothetical protein PMI11_05232 [Rhizobium sp. CF142]|nr:hypothetical protein [Rhizobium sp. CF142]EJJ26598.1 hypothetical protein PMI11_05232 [Rhizobium sp. CF142]
MLAVLANEFPVERSPLSAKPADAEALYRSLFALTTGHVVRALIQLNEEIRRFQHSSPVAIWPVPERIGTI